MRRSLDRCQPGRRPSSRLLNAAFIAGSLLDRVLPGVLTSDRSDVIIQESYVDRAIAYGVAEGGWQASTVAAHRPDLFVSFDLAVLMHAPLAVRRTRFAARSDATAVDTRTVRDADFEEAFRSTLQRVAGRHREILWADSATRAARDTAVEIAEHVARMAHGVPAGGRR
jgi:dTMP kinase